MNEPLLHFAKRELQALARRRSLRAGVLAAGLVLAIAGPFGTSETLGLPARLIYWPALAAMTLFAGTGAAIITFELAGRKSAAPALSSALAGAAAGAVNTVLILALNAALFGHSPFEGGRWLTMAGVVIPIAVVISFAWRVISAETPELSEKEIAAPPALLRRLPPGKRGALISLSVQDHYVEITTTKGRELVLMRLADAMEEAGDGVQIHRSHWVSPAAVTACRREGGRGVITLSDGRELPVSRSALGAVKERGWL